MPVSVARLRTWLQQLFESAGGHAEGAQAVARSLVEAELAGHESHGLIRVSEYLTAIRTGKLQPAAHPLLVKEGPNLIHVDGQFGFGAYSANWTTERVASKALGSGIAAGALRGCGHLGRAGDYPEHLARSGLFGLAFVNGGGTEPRVSPHGAKRALFGTNPVALAVPGPVGEDPVVADFSTAAVASGKIRVHRQEGLPLPPGWILDNEGEPSTSPEDYYAGGMLLPAAGHKGSALAFFIEVLAGLVAGAGCPGLPDSGYVPGNGLFLVGVRLDFFGPSDQLRASIARLANTLRSLPPLAPDQPVQLCGDQERLLRVTRLEQGLQLSEATRKALREAGHAFGLEPL